MASKTVLQLEFLTDQNKRVRITIPSPKQPVDAAAVQNAMDLIVQKNVFAYPQGVIVKRAAATQVVTDSTEIA
ncbi:DUF2922 domain-containing protein [Alicyclobacillus macrosporangiidus]|uniref:DUF2922 domain-containing protein n=1 Tax=Alicyclobacillus macrosporangiidus TaxID=392015 RepID=A0A1I7KJF4_9BACL|nr:DUF2922 domain-containing protein [Alicyclobacillus macrosporangiidus]SFU97557.1 Protein of unknown function [Alicyclobacillus macrosporangiidus]